MKSITSRGKKWTTRARAIHRRHVQETTQLRNVLHASRPGHDLRYGLSGKKMESMGWELQLGFEERCENDRMDNGKPAMVERRHVGR